ncbi:MAG: ATP-binding cassette domain-containing protein [Planctomycetota bacterium]|jgi:iron(III) transport system ATP-binding protein|nr:ATP-binding cassette domain-containing protein [Planctomycetota bacterium]
MPSSSTDSERRDAPPLLGVKHLHIDMGERTLVRDLSFDLQPGERLVLVGANGTGKTTLLSILAGLRAPTAGEVLRPQTPPGVLFQDGALWPHLTASEHLSFVDTHKDTAWQHKLLKIFQLTELADQRPEAMSGGERLRLGLARALAGRPTWVLMDEPLAHLDPRVASSVRETLPLLLEEIGAASVIITHDPDDVLHFGQRLISLSGRGPTWQGSARFALDSPPTLGLAAFADRGTLLTAVADNNGRAEFGLGLAIEQVPPGEEVTAFLDNAAVRFSDDGQSIQATYVAPDRRGGSWVRLNGRLIRCGDFEGGLRAGDLVRIRIEGRVRPLSDTEPGAERGAE